MREEVLAFAEKIAENSPNKETADAYLKKYCEYLQENFTISDETIEEILSYSESFYDKPVILAIETEKHSRRTRASEQFNPVNEPSCGPPRRRC